MITCTGCNLKLNSTGDDVKTDQRRLKYLKYYTRTVDGSYGPYTVSAVKDYQKDEGLTVDGWTGPITCNDLLLPYITPSKNCQSDNSAIIAKAAALGNDATKIFEWVRIYKNYLFYYNTRLSAVGMLNAASGNCTDLSHLLVALCRAAGIPARYVHGLVHFPVDSLFLNHSVEHTHCFHCNHTFNTVIKKFHIIYGW
ncbi:MAG: peptidoglycan-binding protein [Methanobacterium paludis]|nr:peptidoglycan-binding protein [Methanobacterium paludis]